VLVVTNDQQVGEELDLTDGRAAALPGLRLLQLFVDRRLPPMGQELDAPLAQTRASATTRRCWNRQPPRENLWKQRKFEYRSEYSTRLRNPEIKNTETGVKQKLAHSSEIEYQTQISQREGRTDDLELEENKHRQD
jgi:hypothetical protein